MVLLADRIDALLPQTQCKRCGYNDCRAYAEAIAADETGINRCPPGGEETLNALAVLTEKSADGIDPGLGSFTPGRVAFIIEPLCIGCTKCIQACPVDAIVGAPKLMHTIIESLCTGCELCIPPCPVDCIEMRPVRGLTDGVVVPVGLRERADFFRERYRDHNQRLTHNKAEREEHLCQKESSAGARADIIARRKAEIAAAVARVRAKRNERQQEHKKT